MFEAFLAMPLADFDRPAIINVVNAISQPVKELTYCRDIMLSVPEGRNNIALFNHPAFKSIARGQKTATVKLVQSPKFGTLSVVPNYTKQSYPGRSVTQEGLEVSIDRSSWYYDTKLARIEKDRAVFEIEAGHKKYRLTVNFWIAGIAEENIDKHTECKKLKMHLPDKKTSGSLEDWNLVADRSAFLSTKNQEQY
jgi:hypothetical protein